MKRSKRSKENTRSSHTAKHEPPLDLNAQIDAIKQFQEENQPDFGIRIHQFDYKNLECRLDRDITGSYRLCVFEGTERRFSFTIRCESDDYDILRSSFQEIIEFLDGDRRIADLPKTERLTGHYFGS